MRLGRLVVVVLVVAVLVPATGAAAETTNAWVRPVAGRVVRPFDPPETRFGAGHEGVDLAATPGSAIVAAGGGVVAFAGSVAGARHVVVAHAGGLRTSYSFLATITVRRGEHVERGQVVGTAGGRGQGHDGSVVHIGFRSGDQYLDPMLLFGPVDLTTVVHLSPSGVAPRAASEPSERRGLLDGLAGGMRAVGNVARAAVDATGHLVAATWDEAGRGLAAVARGVGRAANELLPLQMAAARAIGEWWNEQGHCDAHAPPADGTGGSDHRVMVVAGIDSSRTAGGPSLPLPTRALGYESAEVSYFSYGSHGTDYTPSDTEEPLLVAARQLGAQLRALERRDPGREVDLIAHSQGGVVVEAFLTLLYDPSDPAYPPLGTVATLSSPLRGDPLASTIANIRGSNTGRALINGGHGLASAAGIQIANPASAAVRDLDPGSRLMRQLSRSRLPDAVQFTAFGAATDGVVPGTASSRPGATGTVLVPHSLNAHSGIVTDGGVMRALRAALEQRPLPCRSLLTVMAGELIPTAISRLEHDIGLVGGAAGRVVDATG